LLLIHPQELRVCYLVGGIPENLWDISSRINLIAILPFREGCKFGQEILLLMPHEETSELNNRTQSIPNPPLLLRSDLTIWPLHLPFQGNDSELIGLYGVEIFEMGESKTLASTSLKTYPCDSPPLCDFVDFVEKGFM
jgi:hypothetical protein